jgi:hypothetical protein
MTKKINVRMPDKTGGAIVFVLIFLFLFISRQKEKHTVIHNVDGCRNCSGSYMCMNTMCQEMLKQVQHDEYIT